MRSAFRKFHVRYRFRKHADGSPFGGSGSVSAVLFHFQHEVGVAFFAGADERYLVVYAEQFPVQYGAAFVDDVFEPHAARFEIRAYFLCAVGAAQFFVVSEAEQYRSYRFTPFLEQYFQRFECRYHLRFHILRASAVYVTVLDATSERRDFPAFFGRGNYVLVGEYSGG